MHLRGAAREAEREATAKALELLAMMDMGSFADQQVKNLSGGQQRIVEIIRTVATKPPLLLPGERSGGLSPQFVNENCSIISSHKADGATMLMIERNLGLAFKVADRFIIMRDGMVVDGRPIQ